MSLSNHNQNLDNITQVAADEQKRLVFLEELKKMKENPEIVDAINTILSGNTPTGEMITLLKKNAKSVKYLIQAIQWISQSKLYDNGTIGKTDSAFKPDGTDASPGVGRVDRQ